MSFGCDSDCFTYHQLPSGWQQHYELHLVTSHQHNTRDSWMSSLEYRSNVGSTVDIYSSTLNYFSGETLGQNFSEIGSRHLSIRKGHIYWPLNHFVERILYKFHPISTKLFEGQQFLITNNKLMKQIAPSCLLCLIFTIAIYRNLGKDVLIEIMNVWIKSPEFINEISSGSDIILVAQ